MQFGEVLIIKQNNIFAGWTEALYQIVQWYHILMPNDQVDLNALKRMEIYGQAIMDKQSHKT